MSSGRINRNVPRSKAWGWREQSLKKRLVTKMCLIAWSEFGVHRAIGWHRTTKANVGSRLYGVPQGRDPHFFGSDRTWLADINPSKPSAIWSTSVDRVERSDSLACGFVCVPFERVRPYKVVGSKWTPSVGSDSACRAGRPPDRRNSTDDWFILNGVEPTALRHAVSWRAIVFS